MSELFPVEVLNLNSAWGDAANATNELDVAVECLKKGDHGEMRFWLMEAGKHLDTCHKKIQELLK